MLAARHTNLSRLFFVLVVAVAFFSFNIFDQQPIGLFEVNVVSGPGNEFAPTMSADGMTFLFVRSQPGYVKQKIMVMKKVGGKWTNPVPVSFTDERYEDSDPCITPNGSTLYFTSNRPDNRDTLPDFNIWKSELKNGKWQLPVMLKGEVNSVYDEFGPKFAKGRLYFNSFRPGGVGGSDIYAGTLNRESCLDVRNLRSVNSIFNEFDPALSPDGKHLVFSSWRTRNSAGNSDLYASKWNDSLWSNPVNMGKSLNSEGLENTPFFSYDGKSFFFSSTRRNPKDASDGTYNGQFNIFKVTVKDVFP